MNYLVPGWALITVVVTASDFIGTFSKDWVLPYVTSSNSTTQHLEDMLLMPALSGVASWIILDPVLGAGKSAIASILVGAVSSWGADYLYKNIYGKE